jgi:TetR/AcrR family transcriptional repressor of bet genes
MKIGHGTKLSMPRPKNTDQRRAEIADALLKVMVAKGYERSTTTAIARAAGLTKGLLHYHFDSKDEILVEAVKRLVAGLEARYQRFLERSDDRPRKRLEAFVDAHLALGDDADPRAISAWVLIGAEAVRSPRVRRMYARAVKEDLSELTRHIADVLDAEGGTAREARSLAAFALAAIQGSYHLAASSPGLLPPGFAAPLLRRSLNALLDARGHVT